MESAPAADRKSLVNRLEAIRERVAVGVTEDLFDRHQQWLALFGERGMIRAVEDAAFHISFLAGAIESDSVHAFEEHARWAVRMLASRGIEATFLAETLGQIGLALGQLLDERDRIIVDRYIQAAIGVCKPPDSPTADDMERNDSPHLDKQWRFAQAILAGHRKDAVKIVIDAFNTGNSLVDIYVGIIQESLYKVGRLWECNSISVAQEHMATAVAQHVMARLYPLIQASETARGRMIITGVEGEMHQIGANMAADAFQADGWDVRFLGSNLPHEGILEAIDQHRADVVGISTKLLANVPRATSLIAGIRGRFGPTAPRIILGGSAFQARPNLWRELNADGGSTDLRVAIEMARGLVRSE